MLCRLRAWASPLTLTFPQLANFALPGIACSAAQEEKDDSSKRLFANPGTRAPPLNTLRPRGLFSACLTQVTGTGRLVPVNKEGRPTNSASAYRSIVLLSDIAKLFERAVAMRLQYHLEGIGPDLSDLQYVPQWVFDGRCHT